MEDKKNLSIKWSGINAILVNDGERLELALISKNKKKQVILNNGNILPFLLDEFRTQNCASIKSELACRGILELIA